MPGFEFSERIDRPREEVFAFFVDFGRASEWAPEITHVEMLTDGPLRVGARYRELRWNHQGRGPHRHGGHRIRPAEPVLGGLR